MKIEIFDTKEFVDLNSLQEVTSPIIFQRGNVPDPQGLLSTEIFGIDVRSRRQTFAYINLGMPFFHPHVYKAFKRLFRNIEKIVNGSEYYSIDESGALVKDPEHGHTGLEWIYKNWDKIKWERTINESSMRKERLDLITKSKKNEIFTRYQIVIPVFYRDIKINASGGGETDELNNFYSKIIRLVSLLNDRDMFDFTLHSTIYSVQNLMVDVYDYFKHKVERKNGMIRKYLMGKNVDNCVRSVISAPIYRDNSPEDAETKFGYAGIPIAQLVSLCYPYVQAWLRDFFEREYILTKEAKPLPIYNAKDGEMKVDSVPLYKPETYFTEKYIKKMCDRYIHDPEFRFTPIQVPVGPNETRPVAFTGKKIEPNGHAQLSTISRRPMTVTDLLYLACYDVVKDKHAIITRYPVSDSYGLFISRVSPISTLQTEIVEINGHVYRHYPEVEIGLPLSKISIRFIDSMQFSNSYCAGMGADYDGDQVTCKIVFSLEANRECEEIMNSKSFFISPSGKNVRSIRFECPQTMYDLTREPTFKSKKVLGDLRKSCISVDPQDITFKYLTDLFADKKVNGKTVPSRVSPNDIIELEAGEWYNKEKVTTTLGRLMWNKFMIDRLGVREFFPYNNDVMTKKNFMKYENAVTLLLAEDKIDTPMFRKYIEYRDWLGLQLHSIITVSFTEKTITTPKEVKELREELFKKYEKELASGDTVTANKVEKELIDKMVDIIKDDPGFDLYASGARGDINNHLKNLFIMRGAVSNPNTGKFDIMKTSFSEGLRKEDFTAASNSVVLGAYPKSCATADSGYLAKQLMAGMQTEIMGEPGSDCGTKMTLEFIMEEEDLKDFQYRYIDDNGKKTLITSENSKKYIGKRVKLYSPMFCTGKCICEKCAGKQNTKFLGLETSKIATTLTNLNMKKFHDSTIRLNKLDPEDLLINHSKTGIFKNDGTNIVLEDTTFEMYIPQSYFDKLGLAEDLGKVINLFGLVTVGIFKNGKFDHFDTWNVPMWHKYNVFESEMMDVDMPGLGLERCKVIRYIKGQQICASNLIQDSVNAQLFLRQVTYGKVPTTIPYTSSIFVWRKNQKMSSVDFGVPSVIQEVVLACAYRYKKDPSFKFGAVLSKNPSLSEYAYEMAGIRRICQVNSTFTGITFEAFDDMVTTSINRAREHGVENESPLEMLFKL